MGLDGYGMLLSEVSFTCSRLSPAVFIKEDGFIVVPLNKLPLELA